jgi:hypothetical protein
MSVHTIVKSPSAWFVFLPGKRPAPDQWINLAEVSRIICDDDQWVILFSNGTRFTIKGDQITTIINELREISTRLKGLAA